MDRFERAGQAFAELCRVMARLRAPDGCPWDREQTLATLKPYLIEEAYETIDAMDSGDANAHRDELGDVLLQIVFQAELTQETGKFDATDVAHAIVAKLVRRHPHVFGDAKADDAKAVLRNWETIKAAERPKHKGTLDSMPRGLPALLRAMRTGEKAAAVGFDWNHAREVVAKVEEEWSELLEAMGNLDDAKASEPGGNAETVEELGDMLFALVNLSRRLGIDAEAALHKAADKFKRRFDHVEQSIVAQGRTTREATFAELDALWEEAKRIERGGGSR